MSRTISTATTCTAGCSARSCSPTSSASCSPGTSSTGRARPSCTPSGSCASVSGSCSPASPRRCSSSSPPAPIQGFGAGALYNAAYVAIGRAFSETERPRQFALLSSAWVVPGSIAPALGGVIAEVIGWRFVFLGMIVLVPVAAVLALPPDASGAVPGEPDDAAAPVGAALLLAGGAALLVIAARRARPRGCTLPLGRRRLRGSPSIEFRRLTPAGTLAHDADCRPPSRSAASPRSRSSAPTRSSPSRSRVSDGFDPIAVGLLLTPPTLHVGRRFAGSRYALAGRSQPARPRHGRRDARRHRVSAGTSVGRRARRRRSRSSLVAVRDRRIRAWDCRTRRPRCVALSEAEPGRQGAATSAVLLSDTLGAALGAGIAGAIVAAAPSLDWSRPRAHSPSSSDS